jgi:photosystem II stability/assembly factor-like uncharacterized protein
MKTPAFLTTLFSAVLSSATFAQETPWVSTHGPCDDAIRTVAAHPTGYLFIGTNDNGVYRRPVDGEPWTNVSTGLVGSDIQDFLVRPSGAIFACGYGVARSENLGDAWTWLGPAEFLMSIAANSSGHLFVGAWASILRSTDNGATWERLANGLPNAWVVAIEVDGDDNLIAATTWGIFRSADSGESWTFIGPTPFPTALDLQDMAMNANGWICAPVFYEGIYVSTDGGETWRLTTNGLEDLFVGGIAVDDENRILAGSFFGTVYESTNAGLFWNRINPEYRFSSVEALLIDGSGLYAGSWIGGVFWTADGRATWQQMNEGIAAASIYKLATNSNGTVFARGRANMWRSPDHGVTWIPTTFGDDSEGPLAVTPADILFAGISWSGGARSTDDGDTWSSMSGIGGYIADFGFASNGDGFAVAGGFYRSTNAGATWNLLSSPDALTTFAVDAHDHVVGGTIFGHVLRSPDGGVSWQDVATPTTHAFFATFVDPANRIFLASHDGGGLFRSVDDGLSWQRLTSGLADSAIWSMVGNDAGDLFVGTESQGVFRSTDHGETWEPFGDGLPAAPIYSLTMDDVSALYAALPEGGVYRTSGPAVGVPSGATPPPLALEQNAPNPFNPITAIRYVLDRPAHVRLRVYDVLGRHVATLVDERKEAGRHVAVFDASTLPSGVYTYELSTPSLRESRKMVIAR